VPERELPRAERGEQPDAVVSPARNRDRLFAAGVPSRRVREVERARELCEQDGAPAAVLRPDEPDSLLEETNQGPVDGIGLLDRGRGEGVGQAVRVAALAREPGRLDERGARPLVVARRALRLAQ